MSSECRDVHSNCVAAACNAPPCSPKENSCSGMQKGVCHHCFISTTAKQHRLCATTLSSPQEELLQLRLAAGGAEGDGQAAAGRFLSEGRWEPSLLGANCSRAAAAAAQPPGRRGTHPCTGHGRQPTCAAPALLPPHPAPQPSCTPRCQSSRCRFRTADQGSRRGLQGWASGLANKPVCHLSYCGQYRGRRSTASSGSSSMQHAVAPPVHPQDMATSTHLDNVHHWLRGDAANVCECALGDEVLCCLDHLLVGCGVLQRRVQGVRVMWLPQRLQWDLTATAAKAWRG